MRDWTAACMRTIIRYVSVVSLIALEQIYSAPGPDQVELLNKGIRATVFRTLADSMEIPMKVLADSIGLNERTIRYRISGPAGAKRARAGLLTGDETERSYRAYRVFRRAKEVLGGKQAAREWMWTGQRPWETRLRSRCCHAAWAQTRS
jgi:uncharacterized protein (DUF2384 family)